MSRECPNEDEAQNFRGRGGFRGERGSNRGRGCFKCGQEGHMSRECPNEDEAQNFRGRGGFRGERGGFRGERGGFNGGFRGNYNNSNNFDSYNKRKRDNSQENLTSGWANNNNDSASAWDISGKTLSWDSDTIKVSLSSNSWEKSENKSSANTNSWDKSESR